MFHFPDRSTRGALAVALLLGGVPWLAHANKREIVPALSLSQQYDSNAFNRADVVLADLLTTVSPRLRFDEEGDWGRFQLQYILDSQIFQRFSQRNSTDQSFLANGERMLTPRLTLTGNASLRLQDNVDRFQATQDLTISENASSKSGNGSLGLRYRLSPRATFSVSANGALIRNNDRSRFDTTNVGAQMSFQYIPSRLSSIQLQLGLSKSRFDSQSTQTLSFFQFSPLGGLQRITDQLSRDTQIDNQTLSLGGAWVRMWTPAWRSTITLGVSSVTSSQEVSTASMFGGSTQTTTKPPSSMTFTGGFTLTRQSRLGRLDLSFNRQTRPSTGEGATLDVNSFSAVFARRLSRRLSFDLRGNLQKSLSSFSGSGVNGSSIDTQVINLSGGINWQLSQQLGLFLRVNRTEQTTVGTRFSQSFDEIVTTLGFRYNFPIDLL